MYPIAGPIMVQAEKIPKKFKKKKKKKEKKSRLF